MPNTLNLKDYARSYEWQGVTFWLLPYRTMRFDVAERELGAAHPQWEYTHKTTGKQTTDEPPDHRAAIIIAQNSGQPPRSHWLVKRLWGVSEDVYIALESTTFEIEFPADDLNPHVQALADYWKLRPADYGARWQVFSTLLSKEVIDAWGEGFLATREHSMDAPLALQSQPGEKADPKVKPPTSGQSSSSSAKSGKPRATRSKPTSAVKESAP